MKKRLLSLGLVAAMSLSVFTACNDTADTSSSSTNATEETTTAGGSVAEDGYAYVQDLNIIDDNYRNYYEIFVYSFYDSDGNGIGDINGVTQKLDYIEDMGCNGIWLMPIMPSNTYHKYDVKDYYGIDPQYGTIEDFKKLADECEKRDIKLIIDFVINHSSSQHEWFKEATKYLRELPAGATPSAEECKYYDYYNFSTTKANNTWFKVSNSNYYYEGSFWDQMPDLNLQSPELRKELEDTAKFWIEDMGVDGFRMDAVMHFDEVNTQLNVDTIDWFYNYCLTLDPEFYMVSEVWADQSKIAEYYKSDTPSYFNFSLAGPEGTLISAGRGTTTASVFVNQLISCQESYSANKPDYIDAPFITNHDMGRVANALASNPAKLKMTAGLLLTMNGSPFVYYGEEIGMKSSGDKDENKRLPMVWSKTDATGMTKGPSAADKGIESSFDGVDAQLEDDLSLLNYYKRAIRIRNENPEIARGTIKAVESLCEKHQAAITKTWNGSTIGIVYNTSSEEITVDISGTDLEKMGIRGYLTTNGEVVTLKEGKLVMPPRSICILK